MREFSRNSVMECSTESYVLLSFRNFTSTPLICTSYYGNNEVDCLILLQHTFRLFWILRPSNRRKVRELIFWWNRAFPLIAQSRNSEPPEPVTWWPLAPRRWRFSRSLEPQCTLQRFQEITVYNSSASVDVPLVEFQLWYSRTYIGFRIYRINSAVLRDPIYRVLLYISQTTLSPVFWILLMVNYWLKLSCNRVSNWTKMWIWELVENVTVTRECSRKLGTD